MKEKIPPIIKQGYLFETLASLSGSSKVIAIILSPSSLPIVESSTDGIYHCSCVGGTAYRCEKLILTPKNCIRASMSFI